MRTRSRTNRIVSLRRADGAACSNQEELEELATSFYKTWYEAQDNTEPEEVLQHVPQKLTDEMNELLCAPFSDAEIEKALSMIGPDKSPGPDGFTAGFYQRH